MKQHFFEFAPTHNIILAANHKPVIRGTTHASWRRIKLVPFTVTIPDGEKDKALPEKLKAGLPGILNWSPRGCLDWQREGFAEPDEVRQATANHRSEQDLLAGFIEECCVVGDATYRVRRGERYSPRRERQTPPCASEVVVWHSVLPGPTATLQVQRGVQPRAMAATSLSACGN